MKYSLVITALLGLMTADQVQAINRRQRRFGHLAQAHHRGGPAAAEEQ